MLDTIQESSNIPGINSSTNDTVTLLFGREPSRVIANANCVLIEPIRTPNVQTIIPLNQIISIRACYCSKSSSWKSKRRLTCDCIKNDPSDLVTSINPIQSSSSSNVSTSAPSAPRSEESTPERSTSGVSGSEVSSSEVSTFHGSKSESSESGVSNSQSSTPQSSTPQSSTSQSSTSQSSTSQSSTSENSKKLESRSGEVKKSKSERKSMKRSTKVSKENLRFVRIYYGVAVGEHQWKVTSVSLKLDNVSKDDLNGNKRNAKRRNRKVASESNVSKVATESNVSKVATESNVSKEAADSDLDSNGNEVNNVLNWIRYVSNLINELKRPKNLLIFINPFGGKKLGPKIMRLKIEPLLKLSGIKFKSVLTERANHARDLLEDVNNPLADYDGFICIGGDGMFAELINGILIRTQIESGIDYNVSNCKLAPPRIPIGVIPAGSTDAVAFGVTGINDPITSMLHILFGNLVNIDVTAVHSIDSNDTLIRYATTFLGYGYFGDVLLDSERNRWMGPSRYDWAGFKKLLAFKRYEGEIKLYTSNVDGSPKDKSVCSSDCATCERTGERVRHQRQLNNPNLNPNPNPNPNLNPNPNPNPNGIQNNNESNDNEEISMIGIKGRFLAVNCATMSCRCEKSKKGMSPSGHLGNGCCDLILVSECSRINYLRFLMRTGFLNTSAFDLPFVDVYRVRAFEYYPLEGETSAWNCDGEIISQPSLRVKIHCQLLPVFGAGRENRHASKPMGGHFLNRKHRKIAHATLGDGVESTKDKNLNHQIIGGAGTNDRGISLTMNPGFAREGMVSSVHTGEGMVSSVRTEEGMVSSVTKT